MRKRDSNPFFSFLVEIIIVWDFVYLVVLTANEGIVECNKQIDTQANIVA